MHTINTTILLFMMCWILNPSLVMSQTDKIWKEGAAFHSVFQHLPSGNFQGTANGVVFVKKSPSSEEIILDFQGGKAELSIEEDEYEIYDVSAKIYHGFTTSGRSRIRYETYATANAIAIEVGGEWYELSLIDGACDLSIHGIEYIYKAEASTEYLVIRVSRELELTNATRLNDHQDESEEVSPLTSLFLLPESTIVFAMKR